MAVMTGVFGTSTDVMIDASGDGCMITLYIAGKPSGQQHGRADYWGLSLDDAVALGTRLIEEAGRARALEAQRSPVRVAAPTDAEHRDDCPYCRYVFEHSMREWNELAQHERAAIVAERTCTG